MEVAIHSLSEFLNILNRYKQQFSQTYRSSGFIFRGMSNSTWKLLPGILREYPEPQKSSTVVGGTYSGKIYSAYESEILAHFRKEASGFLHQIPQKDEFTWLQYAQHYGVPTRLLDFTANPLVAMYFCCQNESLCDGAIWIVNAVTFQSWSQDELICSDMGPDFTREAIVNSIMREMRGDFDYGEVQGEPRPKKQRPVFFVPPYIDQRMNAQSSRFLLWGDNSGPLEDMIGDENWMQLLPECLTYTLANDQRFLAKITVPGSCKHSIMRELDLLNTNEKSIFPGLDGIGRYINKYYKNNADDLCEFFKS